MALVSIPLTNARVAQEVEQVKAEPLPAKRFGFVVRSVFAGVLKGLSMHWLIVTSKSSFTQIFPTRINPSNPNKLVVCC